MNNRQAGAYRELVRKEERAREKWMELHGNRLNQSGANTGIVQNPDGSLNYNQSTLQPSVQPNYGETQGVRAQTPQQPAQQQYDGNNYQDASLPLAPSSVYDQAIRISSPRLSDADEVNIPSTVQRRVVRQVEVPFTRNVKVPVTTRQIVPVQVEKKVKVKRLVEVPTTKLVDEQYTEVIQQPSIRSKEIWVKKVVPERYSQPITITKTRKVSVPTTELREVDSYEIVRCTEDRAVNVPGYRVDEVQDSRLVEVEELQNFQLQPLSTGQAQVLSAREIGPISSGFHHSRRVGTEVYHPEDARHAHIAEDNLPYSGLSNGSFTQRPASNQGYRNGANTFRSTGQQQFNGSSTARSTNRNFAAPSGSLSAASTTATDASIGFKVRDSEQNGVVVFRVAAGEAGERAGLRQGDLIIYANNRPTRTLAEFRQVVNSSVGPVLLQVRRRGVMKLLLTVHR